MLPIAGSIVTYQSVRNGRTTMQCHGITKNGERCKLRATLLGYCNKHQQQGRVSRRPRDHQIMMDAGANNAKMPRMSAAVRAHKRAQRTW